MVCLKRIESWFWFDFDLFHFNFQYGREFPHDDTIDLRHYKIIQNKGTLF